MTSKYIIIDSSLRCLKAASLGMTSCCGGGNESGLGGLHYKPPKPDPLYKKILNCHSERSEEYIKWRLLRHKNLLIVFFILISFSVSAQLPGPLLHFSQSPGSENGFQRSYYFCNNFHSSVKPFYFNDFRVRYNDTIDNPMCLVCNFYPNTDTILNYHNEYKSVKGIYPLTLINTSIKENLIESNFGLRFFYINNTHFKKIRNRTRTKTSKINIDATFNYAVSSFPKYIDYYIAKTHVIPGQGYAHNGKLGYEYNNLNFYIAKNAGKHFVFEAGFGKHFFGDGYRSLFLSDAAFSYPYFKITTTIWKIKYVNLWANFKDIREGYDGWFNAKNKYGAFHFFSWNATKRLNLNFFEAVIWAGSGEHHTRGFEFNYLNPLIFYRPVEFSLGSPDNMLLGVGGHYCIGKKHVVYTQIMLDEFLLQDVRRGLYHNLTGDTTYQYGSWFNKQAWQIGYKYFDVAGIKYLNFQSEFNYVRPYTYSHREPIENYGHFNEPLAHPLGANFRESVNFLRYSFRKWYFELEYMHYLTGLDSTGTHFGQNIFLATYDTPEHGNIVVKQFGNKVGQGIRTKVDFIGFKTSYMLIPRLNLRLEAGLILRSQKSVIVNKSENYIFLGLKTLLDNRYYDF